MKENESIFCMNRCVFIRSVSTEFRDSKQNIRRDVDYLS